ncbi:MAG: aminotransferase class III-fold pyridoxal phosphate-dependent enzyme [Promethearchaeota archaeon]
MKRDAEELLKDLCPELEITKNAKEWIQRAEQVVAKTTQSRDIYPIVDHTQGEGPWIYDLKGNQYLDVTAGVAVRALGIRNPVIKDFEYRISEYMRQVPGHDFDLIPQILLAERLTGITPGDHAKEVFFTTSGGRAVESAIKSVMDNSHRFRFVAFRPAFHGRTGYTLALTASKHIQKDFFPQGLDVIRGPYPYCFRCPFGQEEKSCNLECVQYLRDSIEYGGTDIAAIVLEPICGEGGIIPAPVKWFTEIRKLADELDTKIISDEVQAGLGRTGKWWSIEHGGIVPEYICTAKALGGGFPFGAAIGPKPLFTDYSRHSETFGAEPYVSLLSLSVLRTIERDELLSNATKRGRQLLKGLAEIQEASNIIGDVRGRGLMSAVEIVTDKATNAYDSKKRDAVLNNAVNKQRLWILGAGRSSIRFLPPLTITAEQIAIALERFGKAVKSVK